MRAKRRKLKPSDRLGTSIEARFRALAVERGWRVHRQGWPDFLLATDEGAHLVEVKSVSDKLSARQVELFTALETLGLTVKVWWEREPGKLMPWRKFLELRGGALRRDPEPGKRARNPPRYSARELRRLERAAARSVWIDRELGRRG